MNKLQKQNTRTLMQALHGCRKNCSECKENEGDYSELSLKEQNEQEDE